MIKQDTPIAYEEIENPELEQDFVFISYCHGDKDVVFADLMRLNTHGARFWFDENVYAGDNWFDKVTSIINSEHCRGVVFYLSPNSFYSKPMLDEVKLAQNKLNQQNESATSFKICSVNLGRKPVLETLKMLNVSEELFRGFLFAFDEKVHFIARYFDPKSDDHMDELLTFFSERNSLPDEFSVIDYYDGVQIVKYNGANPNVIIPSTIGGKKVNAIGIHAFEKNETLKHVHISEGLIVIDDFAFSHCYNLEKVDLPNSLKIIGYEAFCKCISLTELTFPYNVQKIANHAFYNCSKLKTLNIKSIVPLAIRFAAFEGCESITTINFSNSVEIIEPYAFSNCVSLEYIQLPDSVKVIGTSAFHSCVSLKTVHFKPDNAPDNAHIFSRCPLLQSIIIDEEDKKSYLKNDTWEEYRHLFRFKLETPANIAYNNNKIIWEGSTLAKNYIIRINGKEVGVTSECSYEIPSEYRQDDIELMIKAITNKKNCINSEYSNSLIVDKDAFNVVAENGELVLKSYRGVEEHLILPEEITIIDKDVFYNNTQLKSIVLPPNLRIIRENAFYRCRNLSSIKFPHKLEEIGNYAFWGTRLTGRLSLPTSIKRIGIKAFACCNKITAVSIGSINLTMERGVFYLCLGLKKVNLPKNFKELSKNLFKGCFELSEISIPIGVKRIKEGALASIMKLDKIVIPANASEIETNAFGGSLSLQNISVSPENKVFYDKDGVLINRKEKLLCLCPPNHIINDFSGMETITELGPYCFADNTVIEKLTLPEHIQKIHAHAFERCIKLNELTISGNLKYIGEVAFNKCQNLHKITIFSQIIPDISEYCFDNLADNLKIFVPIEMYNDYLANEKWAKIAKHILVVDINKT